MHFKRGPALFMNWRVLCSVPCWHT